MGYTATRPDPSVTQQLSRGQNDKIAMRGESQKKGAFYMKRDGEQSDGASRTKLGSGGAHRLDRHDGKDSEATSIKLGSVATNTVQGQYEDMGKQNDGEDPYNIGFARTAPGNFAQSDANASQKELVQVVGADQVYNIELRLSPGKRTRAGEPAVEAKVVSMRPADGGVDHALHESGKQVDYRALQEKMQRDGMSYPVPPLVEQLLEGGELPHADRGHITIKDGEELLGGQYLSQSYNQTYNQDLPMAYQSSQHHLLPHIPNESIGRMGPGQHPQHLALGRQNQYHASAQAFFGPGVSPRSGVDSMVSGSASQGS